MRLVSSGVMARNLLALCCYVTAVAAYLELGVAPARPLARQCRLSAPPRLLQGFPEDGDDDEDFSGEEAPDEEVGEARRRVARPARPRCAR